MSHPTPPPIEFPYCVTCGSSRTRKLESASHVAIVDYFRCEDCAHVWSQPKPGEPGEPQDITISKSPSP